LLSLFRLPLPEKFAMAAEFFTICSHEKISPALEANSNMESICLYKKETNYYSFLFQNLSTKRERRPFPLERHLT